MFQRTIQVVAAGVLVVAISSGLYAQKYTLGMSADITASGTGPISTGPSSSGGGSRYDSSLGSYPTLDFNARGQHSSFRTSYSFGFNNSYSSFSSSSKSHAASMTYSAAAGPKWNFNVSDAFEETADSSTFKLLRGDTTIPEDFSFIFDPVLTSSRRTNTVTIGADHRLTERSSLTFGGSNSLLTYKNGSQISGVLSDQQRYSVNTGYSHSLAHGGWSLGYTGSQFAFTGFQRSRSHAVNVGFNHRLSQTLSLNVNGGPSYLETPEVIKHRFGTNASVSVQRAIRDGSFAVSYFQSASDTSGLGSVADNQNVALGMSHGLGRRMTMSLDISAFGTRGKAVSSTSTHGFSGGGTVGFLFARKFSMNVGAQYQHYDGNSLFNLNSKRVFASVRFRNPDLWRY